MIYAITEATIGAAQVAIIAAAHLGIPAVYAKHITALTCDYDRKVIALKLDDDLMDGNDWHCEMIGLLCIIIVTKRPSWKVQILPDTDGWSPIAGGAPADFRQIKEICNMRPPQKHVQ